MSDWTHTRARLAATRRHHPEADTTELRRDLHAARAEDYVRRIVDGAPALTAEQRSKLAVLLLTGGAAA